MKYKYGSYEHDENEVLLTVSRQPVYQSGFMQRVKIIHDIQGFLKPSAATQAAIKTKIEALRSAYSYGGRNAALYHNDGSISAHALLANTCIGGTRVTRLDFPKGTPGEYATIRSYHITVEGEQWANEAQDVLEFSESLSSEGGLPLWQWSQPIEGDPVAFQLTETDVYRVTQSGRAVGRLTWPDPPAPIFSGSNVKLMQNTITRENPTRDRWTYNGYSISWTYVMESSQELTGKPNVWNS